MGNHTRIPNGTYIRILVKPNIAHNYRRKMNKNVLENTILLSRFRYRCCLDQVKKLTENLANVSLINYRNVENEKA